MSNLRSHVFNICSCDRHSPQGLSNCFKYIKEQLKGVTGKISEQEYDYGGNKYKNLVVTFGSGDAKTVLMAHYDTCHSVGADDNASSCAYLIEFAKTLKEQDVEIVFNTLEEPPVFGSTKMGSYIYASSKDMRKVKLAVNFEMIGYYTEAEKWLDVGVYNDKALVERAKEWLGRDFIVNDVTNERSYRDMSDHMWFFGHDVPTMIISNTGVKRNKNYHTEFDTPDTLDYKTMKRLCTKISAFLLTII